MKRTLVIGLCFIFTSAVFSQEKVLDTAYLKCQYKYTYLKDTLDIATFDDLLILQIGRNISKSYSYYTFQSDSLSKTPDGDLVRKEIFNRSLEDFKKHRDRNKFLNSFPRPRSATFVYKHYPQGKMTVTDATGVEGVIYIDSLNMQEWQMTDSIKTILCYSCQMAKCDFRGRHWTVWFSPDIPISDGPWKLNGLPGLIMEAYDRGHQYYFSIVGLEKVKEEPIVFTEPSNEKGKFTSIDRKEFLRIRMNRLTHSASFMEAEEGFSFGKDKPLYRDLIERDYK